MTDPLERMAKWAEGQEHFLAFLLAMYAQSEGLDDASLAAALGCCPEDLVMVRLCRAPRLDRQGFRDDVARIADRFDLDPKRLSVAVKRGRVLACLQDGPSGHGGFLMAARDDEDDPPPEAP